MFSPAIIYINVFVIHPSYESYVHKNIRDPRENVLTRASPDEDRGNATYIYIYIAKFVARTLHRSRLANKGVTSLSRFPANRRRTAAPLRDISLFFHPLFPVLFLDVTYNHRHNIIQSVRASSASALLTYRYSVTTSCTVCHDKNNSNNNNHISSTSRAFSRLKSKIQKLHGGDQPLYIYIYLEKVSIYIHTYIYIFYILFYFSLF